MKNIPMPAQFDGTKFADRYALGDFDFHETDGRLYFPDHLPDRPIVEGPDPVVPKEPIGDRIGRLEARIAALET